MVRAACCFVALLSMAYAISSKAWGAPRETEVDLALVLAVDVSFSMEPDERNLQREGFIAAFRSHEVQEAIRKGMLGRIALTYIEWAGVSYQNVIVPWTVIESEEEALNFSAHLAESSAHQAGYTSISGAIDFGAKQLQDSGIHAARKVIDISGDGHNNQGRSITLARDEAVAQGITINGLPIMLKEMDDPSGIQRLDFYYRDCVIGGPGAFMIPVRNRGQFIDAIKTKVLWEIAARIDRQNLVQPAQAESASNCSAREVQGR